jgi:DNA end-binding protein Ku
VAARAIWKGVIRFADVELPVKLYSAVEDRTVHFNLLDRDAGSRVKQRMVVPSSGDPVPREEIRKGFETRPGEFVVLSDEEVEELSPEASRDIEITRFVPEAEVDHTWYDRPYYLGPDDSGGDDVGRDYFALAEALAKRGREGVARWVMRNKEYVGALRAEGDHLALITLRHPGEVIPADALSPPGGRKLDAKELDMAEQLVEALADAFEPESYADDKSPRAMRTLATRASAQCTAFPSTFPKPAGSSVFTRRLPSSASWGSSKCLRKSRARSSIRRS